MIESAPAHAVIELKGIEGTMTIEQLIQPYKGVPIDPNLYETGSIMKDVLFGVGAQEADLGQTNDATATQSSIAEQSRMATLSSNIDDLNEFLSELARAASQVLLYHMSRESVVEIVGPGAVWPEMSGDQISKELFLEIKAGSTGRPNQAAELANLERALPFLIQIPGTNPKALGSKLAELLDLDEEEFVLEGIPSIVTINAMAQAQAKQQMAMAAAPPGGPGAQGGQKPPGPAQPGTGDPATDPASQGAAGADNAPKAPGAAPQGQPAYTQPVHRYDASGQRIG